jgi:hypothetical protein
MGKVMITLRSPRGAPSIEEIEREYALQPTDIDREFGVVQIDDLEHEYTILVEESAVHRIRSTDTWSVSGPFSNPRIGPAGPPGTVE